MPREAGSRSLVNLEVDDLLLDLAFSVLSGSVMELSG